MAEAAKEHTLEQHSHHIDDDDQCAGSEQSTSPEENDAFLFFSYLDEIDGRIEYLRRHAIALSQEKESLLLVLSQLKEESMTSPLTKDEFQEICVNMDRLSARCKTVDIKVQTIRTPEQEVAFEKVNNLVNELEKSCSLTDEKSDAYKRAKSFLNACSSDAVENGAIDFKFQGMILDCVIEDQKHVRYRLESIVKNSLHPTVNTSRSECVVSNNESSEKCVRPSAIASAVKDNPHFKVVEDSSTELSSTSNHPALGIDHNNGATESSLKDCLHIESNDIVSSKVGDDVKTHPKVTDASFKSQKSPSDMESS